MVQYFTLRSDDSRWLGIVDWNLTNWHFMYLLIVKTSVRISSTPIATLMSCIVCKLMSSQVVQICSGLSRKLLLPGRSKRYLDSMKPCRDLHGKVVHFLFCTRDFLCSVVSTWSKKRKRIIRTAPSCNKWANAWTILRAGNGASGITSRKGLPVLMTFSTFSMTLANVDSGWSLSHSSICVKNLSSSSQFSSQGG